MRQAWAEIERFASVSPSTPSIGMKWVSRRMVASGAMHRSLITRASLLAVLAVVLRLPVSIAAQIDPSSFAALRWRLVGPYRAGRVSAGAIDPSDPNTYYFGT